MNLYTWPLALMLAVALLFGSLSKAEDPSQRLKFAERNQGIEPFGSKENERRLVKLIKETIVPKSPKPDGAKVDAILPWSEPVNGLVARIEHAGSGGYEGFVVLLGLKNVSARSISVPTGNSADSHKMRLFDLYEQQGNGQWVSRPWLPKEHLEDDERRIPFRRRNDRNMQAGNRRDLPAVLLKPGESCLVYLCGTEVLDEKKEDSLSKAVRIKIVLRQAAAKDPERWEGVLETPPHPMHTPQQNELLVGRLPFPEHFPPLSHARFMGGNMSGMESEVRQISISNWTLIHSLALYEPAGVQAEFERRMLAEKDSAMKLLLAAIAAENGSETAGLYLLETMKDTDYTTVTNVHDALGMVLAWHANDPPDWIRELVQAALSDERYVTGLDKTNWASGTTFQIWYLADEHGDLALRLGQFRCRKAVPFLIEMVKRTKGSRMPIMALGEMGDPRAIPVLLDALKAAGKNVKYSEGFGLPESFSRPVQALADLKAKEAVPTLLEYIEFPNVVEAMERIGDPRALPAMRELITAQGKVLRDGKPLHPNLDQERLFAAKLAVASLDQGDAVPRLCEMLGDKSLGEFQRRTVVWRLGDRRDLRAVPSLIGVIKTDPSGAVVNQAIAVLSVFKSKAAVEGLIECLDANFGGKTDWKRAYTPAMFRENIAESLRAITGQPFGRDEKQWLQWWQEKGKSSIGLK